MLHLSWILTYACYLLLDELQLHVLDLDPDQQEVDLPNNDVLEVVSNNETCQEKLLELALFWIHWESKLKLILLGFIVFKLNVQTVFDADLHLNRVVDIWVGG